MEDYDSGRYWTGGNDFVDSLEKDLSLEDLEPGQWSSYTIGKRTRYSSGITMASLTECRPVAYRPIHENLYSASLEKEVKSSGG